MFCVLLAADTCLNPQVKQEVYTSTESHMSYETVIVIEFTLTCKNGLKVRLWCCIFILHGYGWEWFHYVPQYLSWNVDIHVHVATYYRFFGVNWHCIRVETSTVYFFIRVTYRMWKKPFTEACYLFCRIWIYMQNLQEKPSPQANTQKATTSIK